MNVKVVDLTGSPCDKSGNPALDFRHPNLSVRQNVVGKQRLDLRHRILPIQKGEICRPCCDEHFGDRGDVIGNGSAESHELEYSAVG